MRQTYYLKQYVCLIITALVPEFQDFVKEYRIKKLYRIFYIHRGVEQTNINKRNEWLSSLSSHQCRVALWRGFFGHGQVAFSPPEVAGHLNRPFLVWWVSALHFRITKAVRQ